MQKVGFFLVLAAAIAAGVYFVSAKFSNKKDVKGIDHEAGQIGREVGLQALAELTRSFQPNPMRLQRTDIPAGFHNDAFVAGFFISYINSVRVHSFSSVVLPDLVTNAYMQSALKVLEPSLKNPLSQNGWLANFRQIKDTPEAKLGANVATAMVMVIAGKIDENYDDPLIKAAHDVSKNMIDDMQFIMNTQGNNQDSKAARQVALMYGLHLTTVDAYMRHKYPEMIY